MSLQKFTMEELKAILTDFGESHQHLTEDNLFTAWFLRAYLTDNDQDALEAATGASNDKGIDALLIDTDTKSVFVVQAKFHSKIGAANAKRADVLSLVDTARYLTDQDEEAFNEYIKNANPVVSAKLIKARRFVQRDNYRIRLYFVTTGKCSSDITKNARIRASKLSSQVSMDIITGQQILLLARDYLDGVAPPIPAMDLEMESGANVKVNGVAQRFDHLTHIESWVFSMRGQAVAQLYETAGIRLFARNIRGFLGPGTPVNQSMAATLEHEPERFFYFNNGITIICDRAERRSERGVDVLSVSNPQIINGQQTTRTLATHARMAEKASVLVKVICITRSDDNTMGRFDTLVSSIVAGTNWQNAIRSSDLMANDRIQVELERNLRKAGFTYLRKRQNKRDIRSLGINKNFAMIKKENLAQAVAGCDLDPAIVRSGRERLFEEELYPRVFPNSDIDFYLPRYCLMRKVSNRSRKYPERGYAKWLVLNFMWTQLSGHLRKRHEKRNMYRMWYANRKSDSFGPLEKAIEIAFRQGLRYYRQNAGTGSKRMDPSSFFRSKKGRDKEFMQFWKTVTPSAKRRSFDKHIRAFVKEIAEFTD